MNITFVYPDILDGSSNWTGHFYPGIGWLSAVLREGGHSVSLLHITRRITQDKYWEDLQKTNPDLVAFSSTSLMFEYAALFAKWTKEWRDILTICGGIHPTICPEEVLADENFDMACIGEGEEALLELCNSLEDNASILSVRNLWIRHQGQIVKNEIRPLIQDLDSLPFPDRSIFYKRNDLHFKHGTVRVMASRGCPFQCSYCCNHVKYGIYGAPRNYVRFRSVQNVIDEIHQIIDQDPSIRSIWFDDDILPLRREWFREFTQKYKEEIGLPYECQSRIEFIDEEIVDLLADSGCFRVDMGIESGNEPLRQTIMGRRMSNEEIIEAFSLCHDRGMKTNSLNMIGLPNENMSMVLDTIKLNARVRPERTSVYIFYPFKGSDLYRLCKQQGSITNRRVTSLLNDTKLNLNELTRDQLRFTKRNFASLVNLYRFLLYGQESRLSWLSSILDTVLSSRLLSPTLCWIVFHLETALDSVRCSRNATQ